MYKENYNRSAAGLRRSAIAERIRLREEWSELKGVPDRVITDNRQKPHKLMKHVRGKDVTTARKQPAITQVGQRTVDKTRPSISETLVGVVALVDVGTEPRALPLRAALTALGASVVPAWVPFVTHLVWSQGGCRATRTKARVLATRLVSPLWVEACAAAGRRLPEQAFPAAPRASDPPSPRTLRRMLKKAEMENIPLTDLLLDKSDEKEVMPRLRLSSENDTSHDTSRDTTADTSHNTTADTSKNTTITDIQCRVNTAPRRALPMSISSPQKISKSRRKLFTQKEGEDITKSSDDETETETRQKRVRIEKPAKRELPRAARKLLAACSTPARTPAQPSIGPRIVLSGMDKTERDSVIEAVKSLNGRLQLRVTRKTTHVLLGSCVRDTDQCSRITAPSDTKQTGTTVSKSPGKRSPLKNMSRLNISGVTTITNIEPRVVHRSEIQRARTLNALLGAARGCRVLHARWAVDSAKNGAWVHHHGYEVQHLKKISQKARVERSALRRMRSEYAYDIFNGMKVRISPNAEQKDAVTQLLNLCGGVTQDGAVQDGAVQDGGLSQNSSDLTIGVDDGQVNSKWVFDSVAAARMRTTRRYINSNISLTNNFVSQATDR